jgi:hypothetical protein
MRANFLIFLLGILFFADAESLVVRAQTLTSNQINQIMSTHQPVEIPNVTATAEFDPPLVRPGEKSVYRLTFNATEAAIRWPDQITVPPNLHFRKSASGENIQFSAGTARTVASFDFDVHASEPGLFAIPEFIVEAYGKPITVPMTVLDVRNEVPSPHEPARQLLIQLEKTNVFIGETVEVTVLLPATSSNTVEIVSQLQINGDGFLVEKNSRGQAIQPLQFRGRRVQAFISKSAVTPIASGHLTLSAQGFTSGLQFSGPIVITGQVTIPGGPPRSVLLDSETATMNVRPLPEGELPGFTGGVGSYILEQPKISTNVAHVGDPIQLTVTIRGENANRVTPPSPPNVKGWEIFPAQPAAATAANSQSFNYTFIPTSDGDGETPAIPFSIFDPERGAYVDMTIPGMPLTILPGEFATNAETVALSTENPLESKPKLTLSKLAASRGLAQNSLVPLQLRPWFPFVQIAPALVFCGLWFWDRRRRFLEQHPEIVRRRKARRALKREIRVLERAANSGDADGFVQTAVNAMKIASAPHFPAHPRALVCGDVLEVLNGADCNREVVRKFFAAADGAAFGVDPQSHRELLSEQGAVENVLAKLEARLN